MSLTHYKMNYSLSTYSIIVREIHSNHQLLCEVNNKRVQYVCLIQSTIMNSIFIFNTRLSAGDGVLNVKCQIFAGVLTFTDKVNTD